MFRDARALANVSDISNDCQTLILLTPRSNAAPFICSPVRNPCIKPVGGLRDGGPRRLLRLWPPGTPDGWEPKSRKAAHLWVERRLNQVHGAICRLAHGHRIQFRFTSPACAIRRGTCQFEPFSNTILRWAGRHRELVGGLRGRAEQARAGRSHRSGNNGGRQADHRVCERGRARRRAAMRPRIEAVIKVRPDHLTGRQRFP